MKKVIAIVLSIILILSLVGCSSDGYHTSNSVVYIEETSINDTSSDEKSGEMEIEIEEDLTKVDSPHNRELSLFRWQIVKDITEDSQEFESAYETLRYGKTYNNLGYSLSFSGINTVLYSVSGFKVEISLCGKYENRKLLIQQSYTSFGGIENDDDIKNFINSINKIDTGYNFLVSDVKNKKKLCSRDETFNYYKYQHKYNEDVLFKIEEKYGDDKKEHLYKRSLTCTIPFELRVRYVAIHGAIIEEQDGKGNYSYRRKCEKCGWIDDDILGTNVGFTYEFHCPDCYHDQIVEIVGK